MKITAALAILITFSVSVKLSSGASAPPQDDADYTGGSGDHAGDPQHGGPTLSPHLPYNPATEGSVLPPAAADYDDEDYADYDASGDDYPDYGGSSTTTTQSPPTTTTTESPTTTSSTTTSTSTTSTTTTTTSPPTDVLAENGIHGTVDAGHDNSADYYDEEYYDENDENYDDEDYGAEGSGAAPDYPHAPDHPGAPAEDETAAGRDEGAGVEDHHDHATENHDDDLWEDDFSAHRGADDDHADHDDGGTEHHHDAEDPFVFDGSAGAESESAPVDPPHDSDPQPGHDQEVWVPKVGLVPEDTPPEEDAGAAGAEGGGSMDGSVQIVTHKEHERQVSIFAQPGMLAAFIGGAVVGLLCAILLVMFVVYRMRKKDEGSYPLDEPKRVPLTSSYASSGKEIYA